MNTIDERIASALAYLESRDLAAEPTGKYEVNDTFYYMVQEYVTKSENEALCETHRKYIDLQLLVSGEEYIAVSDVRDLTPLTPYDAQKDVAFWHTPENEMRVRLRPGCFVTLYPQNAHRPCLSVSAPVPVKKVVGKVYIADLTD